MRTSAFMGLAALLLPFARATALQAAPPLYELREELRIVADESSRSGALTKVTGLTLLPDNSIVTFHGRQEMAIRVFDSNGKVTSFFGRPGKGPGEFTRIVGGGSIGNELWGQDAGRVNVLSRTGEALRTITPSAVRRPPYETMLGLLSGDRRLVRHEYPRRVATPDGTPSRSIPFDSVVYGVVDVKGSLVSRFLHVPARKHDPIFVVANRIPSIIDQSLAGTALHAVAPSSARFLIAADAELWGGRPGQVQLLMGDSTGRITHQMLTFAPRPVPADYLDQRLARFSTDPAGRAALRADIRGKYYLPEYYPVLQNIMLGRDGSIWVEPVYETEMWTVFVNGTAIRRVRIPRGRDMTIVWAVSRDNVWVTKEDADEVPIILRYGLAPARN